MDVPSSSAPSSTICFGQQHVGSVGATGPTLHTGHGGGIVADPGAASAQQVQPVFDRASAVAGMIFSASGRRPVGWSVAIDTASWYRARRSPAPRQHRLPGRHVRRVLALFHETLGQARWLVCVGDCSTR